MVQPLAVGRNNSLTGKRDEQKQNWRKIPSGRIKRFFRFTRRCCAPDRTLTTIIQRLENDPFNTKKNLQSQPWSGTLNSIGMAGSPNRPTVAAPDSQMTSPELLRAVRVFELWMELETSMSLPRFLHEACG
jgi:hypothetical protein